MNEMKSVALPAWITSRNPLRTIYLETGGDTSLSRTPHVLSFEEQADDSGSKNQEWFWDFLKTK